MNKKNIIGNRYGRLVVKDELPQVKHRRYFKCLCDCGKEKNVSYSSLTTLHVKSCGCLRHENNKNLRSFSISNTEYIKVRRIYNIWHCMLTRVSKDYYKAHRYIERNINICEEWKKDYKKFEEWALNNGYGDNLTIDRKDNDKGYSPDNCRWVDLKTQENNRENNHRITYKGETHTISEWSDILMINYYTLATRLKKWSVEDAFTRPVRVMPQRSF